jgi:vancomycin resistance protein YoaR
MKRVFSWFDQARTWQQVLLGLGVFIIVLLALSAGLQIAFANKILPGVIARGVHVGGLSKAEATQLLNERAQQYVSSSLSVAYGDKTISVQPSELGLSLDNKTVVEDAYDTGRNSDLLTNIANQTMLLAGFYPQENIQANFDQEKLSAFLMARNNELVTPAQNATYQLSGSDLVVQPNTIGARLDMGQAILSLGRATSELQKTIKLPAISVVPARNQESLLRQKDSATQIAKNPLTLSYQSKTWEVSRQQLLDWLTADITNLPSSPNLLTSYYRIPEELGDFKLEKAQLDSYLQSIGGEINQEPVDAQLTISGERATVFKQSRDGRSLDLEKSTQAIMVEVAEPKNGQVALVVNVKKADVNDSNIDKLGIKELISEGKSYFPGSSAARLQNIRVGTNRYDGVLLKPGQVFSFGEILGEVGAAQGYAESKVILDGRQEFQYGGGLCQVSSTAFRAALNAGLPILQRTNHAFQVSYYTEPYGTPGVDATIYYPDVDFKFKNDTANHILIQTEFSGTTLKFKFYGTKEKEGRIRGPEFMFGSLNPNQPSQTVFYRDILVGGQVTKTDTFTTYYKSALDFPTSN